MQRSQKQGEHWMMIANFRQNLPFAGSLGRENYSFLKQHYKQMMPESLQSRIPAFAVSARNMQLSNSLNSDNKKLLEFTMLMYFES